MAEDGGFDNAMRSIDAGLAVLASIAVVCAQAYATDKFRAQPLIVGHFTAGNEQRMGWQPLAGSTLQAKNGTLKKYNFKRKVEGRRQIRGDASQTDRLSNYQHAFMAKGNRAESIQPMLVRSGELKDYVTTEGTVEAAGPGRALIVYANPPPYAHWHVTGGTKPGRPPKRDWTEPTMDDIEQMRLVGQQFADQSIGRGRVDPLALPG